MAGVGEGEDACKQGELKFAVFVGVAGEKVAGGGDVIDGLRQAKVSACLDFFAEGLDFAGDVAGVGVAGDADGKGAGRADGSPGVVNALIEMLFDEFDQT